MRWERADKVWAKRSGGEAAMPESVGVVQLLYAWESPSSPESLLRDGTDNAVLGPMRGSFGTMESIDLPHTSAPFVW